MFNNIYQGRRVFVTGHTGFKGSWLALWLQQLGALVEGYALPPPAGEPAHWPALGLDCGSTLADIRDAETLKQSITHARPEIVFHLAAQPLVLASYQDPLTTWQTNVMGTANLLEACRAIDSVKAVVVITTDKCYENKEWSWGYRETDTLGGYDPYSASKAAAELVAASYRSSFAERAGAPRLLIATARAGNVIGGGDWAQNRLIPDVARAVAAGQTVDIRNPLAIRPWQHVLESLSAYLLIGERLLADDETVACAWNVGPVESDIASVGEVLTQLGAHWSAVAWRQVGAVAHETSALRLDSSHIRSRLGWQPVWRLQQALAQTGAWYQDWMRGELISLQQLQQYQHDAAQAGLVWAR
ncbi:CDP-glucose 4,6-dehydratase [Silvimonas amylolytica]|uniref:CDP-glucose 4,6-dehydratase n=1 Tax=Silvimonas amylolytica TaxID=449663 RepID=A0ABQ2PH81_9NEIS|nr:CDP-glucose 4,6-dehydratase [Silvimonas amylolytica]GGP24606.1 CDP-glucose 4,6-dehydratase [Silvimonas amylolytica]